MAKPKTKKWALTGHQMAPIPYNGRGTSQTHYLERLPESSHPTIFIEAYCYSPEDERFLDRTVEKIVKLLNTD